MTAWSIQAGADRAGASGTVSDCGSCAREAELEDRRPRTIARLHTVRRAARVVDELALPGRISSRSRVEIVINVRETPLQGDLVAGRSTGAEYYAQEGGPLTAAFLRFPT